MSRKHDKGKLPPFVPLFRHTINSLAWKATSVGARATFFELKINYNTKAQNAVYLATRKGPQQLNAGRNSVRKWLRELEHYGFIVKVQGAHLGLKGAGEAARYRLTDCYYAGTAPTYDFQMWSGELFEPAKRVMTRADKERLKRERQKQNPGPTGRPPRSYGQTKGQEARMTQKTQKRSYGQTKGNDPEWPYGQAKTSFTISQPKPVWTTPVLTEVFGEEAARLRRTCERKPSRRLIRAAAE